MSLFLQRKIEDNLPLSIYGSLTVLGSLAALVLFLLAECAHRQKERKLADDADFESAVDNPRFQIWHINKKKSSTY
jgi:hypothetical protein